MRHTARVLCLVAGVAGAAAAAGCTGGPAPLTAAERGQRTRIRTLRRTFHATKFATNPLDAERTVDSACRAMRALKTEGEVRKAVTEIDQHPGFLAQIAVQREGSMSDRADHRRFVVRPQVYLIAVQHVLMRVEIDALYREVRAAKREVLALTEPLRLLGDADFRVAVTAPITMPPHYLASPAMAEWIRTRALEQIERAALSPAAQQHTLAGLPLLFPADITSDVGRYALELLDEFLTGNTAMRNHKAPWILDALKNPELPQLERLILLRKLLSDSAAIDELVTVFDAKAQGAGFVMRRLGLAANADARAAAAMVLPPGSQVIPPRVLLGSEGNALAALKPQLRAPDIAVRAAAALAWEGVPGIDLGDYDPRGSADQLDAALQALDDRIAAFRAKAAAGNTASTGPKSGPNTAPGSGSGGDPLNPVAKPTTPKAEPPSRAKRRLMKKALRAAGLLCDDFVRQLRRNPTSMLDVYEAYRRNHPWGGCHDAGDGRLIHEPSTYHLDVRTRPDGATLTVWADPPPGSGAASYWWDASTGSVRVVRKK